MFMIKNTSCYSRGHQSDSQHPYGDSQPSVTPVLEDLMPSSGSVVNSDTGGAQIYIHTSKMSTHKIKNKNK